MALDFSVSFANPPLMSGRYAHIFAVLGDGTARYLDALGLQALSDVFVGQGMGRVLLFDHLFDSPLQDQKRSGAAGWPLDGFREKITQFKNALRRVCIFIRHSAAHGG